MMHIPREMIPGPRYQIRPENQGLKPPHANWVRETLVRAPGAREAQLFMLWPPVLGQDGAANLTRAGGTPKGLWP